STCGIRSTRSHLARVGMPVFRVFVMEAMLSQNGWLAGIWVLTRRAKFVRPIGLASGRTSSALRFATCSVEPNSFDHRRESVWPRQRNRRRVPLSFATLALPALASQVLHAPHDQTELVRQHARRRALRARRSPGADSRGHRL